MRITLERLAKDLLVFLTLVAITPLLALFGIGLWGTDVG